MTADPTRQILVRCDGAQMTDSWRTEPWTEKLDVSADPDAGVAVNLVIQGFGRKEFPTIRPRTEDLLRIVAAVFRADEMAPRGSDADVHGERWERNYGLCIAVRDPDFWSNPEVQQRLAAVLRFGADDRWQFAFSPLPSRVPVMVQTTLDLGGAVAPRPPESVVLCSGGVDSLAILVEAAGRGERPLAVSHWATPPVRTRQQELLRAVARSADKFEGWEAPSIGVKIHRLGAEARERTRRTRSVLFACLGAAAAGELGVDRVYLGDNGPVSLNLPINDQIVGARASRSTHPVLLRRVADLVALIYDSPIRFANPLWSRTRAEAIDILKQVELTGLLPLTLSCSNWGWGQRSSDTPHCGYCSQCIDRRFATIAAGVEAADPPSRYAHDLFLGPLPDGRATLLALGYVRFAQRVVAMAPLELLAAYPQLAEAVLPDDDDPDATMRELVDLIERHARTVLRVLDERREAVRPLLSRGKVSATSLLILSAVDPTLAVDETPRRAMVEAPSIRRAEAGAGAAPAPTVSTENFLAYRGGLWEVGYEGRTVALKHGDAVVRLAFLLDRPGKMFTPAEVLAGTRTDLAAPVGEPSDEALELRIVGDGDAQPVYDRQALVEFASEITRLTREIAEARAAGKETLAAAKEAECKQIQTFRNQGTRPGNLVRTFVDTRSTIEDTVYQSLHRLLARIDTLHPALGAHLRLSLRHGVSNGYVAKEDVRWRVVLPPKAA